MMNTAATMNRVIPAKAGIKCFYLTGSLVFSRFAGVVQLAVHLVLHRQKQTIEICYLALP